MGAIFQELPDGLTEVDVILAGGGAAACVIAGRLAEADPQLSILVIEQGSNNLGVPTVVHPALFMSGLLPTSNATLFYQSKAEKQLNNRELIVPSGGILGGGSSIALMMYSRGQRCDFDSWNVPGWSADDMIPYLRKFETYIGPGRKSVHGYDGPITVSEGTWRGQRSTRDYIQAAGQVGYPEIEDLSALDYNNGVQPALHFIGTDGRRSDTASGYIHPKIQSGKYPGLNVLVDTQVKRVIFEGKKAIGVEIRPNPKVQANGNGTYSTIRARKLVIVSAGALGTPLILERSGIGNPDILKKAGIDVVSPLSAVGENYQDHHLITYPYYTDVNEDETLDALFSGRLDAQAAIQQNAAILGWNAQDVTGKLRPTDEEVADLGPAFQANWDNEYKNNTNKPLFCTALVNFFPADPTLVPAGQYLTASVFTGYPLSRGSMHISGPELDDKPDFTTGFFTDPDDVDVLKHVWAYKKSREIFRRMKSYRGEVEILHPQFAPNSSAKLVRLNESLSAGNISNVEYTPEDDKAIEKWVRNQVGTTWHSLGTCRMGPRGDAVVDQYLSVYGVEGLKVADMSIPPENVAANTMSTAVAIGEKAADIFIKELGLSC